MEYEEQPIITDKIKVEPIKVEINPEAESYVERVVSNLINWIFKNKGAMN